MDALIFLTYLTVILLLGIISTLISRRIKVPNILLLIIMGMLLNVVNRHLEVPIEFPGVFLTAISILALVMIVFDSSSRFTLRMFDKFSIRTLWLSIVFLAFNLVFLTIFLKLVFGIESIFLAMLFAALMSGTDPAAVLSMFKNVKNRVLETLKIESLINTPLIIILPFVILDIMKTAEYVFPKFMEQAGTLLQQFVSGIGAGVLIGLIIFKVMKRKYVDVLSPLAVVTAALMSYVLAELLGGNGVLAVTTMGILFGNLYLRHKKKLHEFSWIFTSSLEILVFVLLGFIIFVRLDFVFLVKSALLFLIYLLIRYISIEIALRKLGYSVKDKFFMSLNVQKGIAVAVVAFTLTNYAITENVRFVDLPGAMKMLDIMLMFIIYSIILSTIVSRISKYFIKVEVKP